MACKFKASGLQFAQSGRRDSNPPPSAWEADALPDELLPLMTPFDKELLSLDPPEADYPDELLPLISHSKGDTQLGATSLLKDENKFFYETTGLIFTLSQLSFTGIIHLSPNSFFEATTLLKNNVCGVIKLFSRA